jgi:hypothetical protein
MLNQMRPHSALHARWMAYGYSCLASDVHAWANNLRAQAEALVEVASSPAATAADRRSARRAQLAADRASDAARRALDGHKRAQHESISGDEASRYHRTSAHGGDIYPAWRMVRRLIDRQGVPAT